jgi:pilus assembly protein CpaB
MRVLALIVLVLGLFLSGGAVWYMFGQFKSAEARLRDAAPQVIRIPTVKVAVAVGGLYYGQPITAESARMIDWPEASVPKNAFTDMADLFDAKTPSRVVLRRMEEDEPILRTKVSGFGERATVAALLDAGMLAHTIKVDSVGSVGGFLLPGTHIDVMLTFNDAEEGIKTVPLLQNIEVIAVDQDTDPDRIAARLARTVTVQVTPAENKALILASNIGKVNIALRGFNSTEEFSTESLNRRQLLGDPAAETRSQRPPEVTVRVRRGSEGVETLTVE